MMINLFKHFLPERSFEMADGDKSGIEIERRFIVLEFDREKLKHGNHLQHEHFVQGYFQSGSLTTRVRIVNGVKAFLTRKTGKGLSRKEEERSISVNSALFLMEGCEIKIEKERYFFENTDCTLDVFLHGFKGLFIAEIELLHEKSLWQLPAWIYRSLEITDKLSNGEIATLGCRMGRDALTGRVPQVFLEHLRVSARS